MTGGRGDPRLYTHGGSVDPDNAHIALSTAQHHYQLRDTAVRWRFRPRAPRS